MPTDFCPVCAKNTEHVQMKNGSQAVSALLWALPFVAFVILANLSVPTLEVILAGGVLFFPAIKYTEWRNKSDRHHCATCAKNAERANSAAMQAAQ
jgi:hypothetical protein